MTSSHPWGFHFVPPFIDVDITRAEKSAKKRFGRDKKIVTVLAYDEKVGKTGIEIALKLNRDDIKFVFFSADPKELKGNSESSKLQSIGCIEVLRLPDEEELFGAIAVSNLAIVKNGFMQITECLSLGTPVVSVYHEGCFPGDLLYKEAEKYVIFTEDCNPECLNWINNTLNQGRPLDRGLHGGELHGAREASHLLEKWAGKKNLYKCSRIVYYIKNNEGGSAKMSRKEKVELDFGDIEDLDKVRILRIDDPQPFEDYIIRGERQLFMVDIEKTPVKKTGKSWLVIEGVIPLNGVGNDIWNLVDGRRTISYIVREISSEYRVGKNLVEGDVLKFLSDMARLGLVSFG
jgi:hypothetical protein